MRIGREAHVNSDLCLGRHKCRSKDQERVTSFLVQRGMLCFRAVTAGFEPHYWLA
jgi:hypothetical protein